jgi:hypothetical protein
MQNSSLKNIRFWTTGILNQYRGSGILWLIILPLVLISSCSPIRTIPVEIALKPKEHIPENIQSLTLINRSINHRYNNPSADSLQLLFFQRQFRMDTIMYDTKASDTMLVALGDLLFESGRYDIVIPENSYHNVLISSDLPSAMPWHEVDTLVQKYNTDAVLAIEHFRTRIITNFQRESLFDTESRYLVNGYSASMRIAYEILFRIYNPAEREILKNIAVLDTLFWEDFDTEIKSLFNRFTPVKSAMIESGIHGALRITEKIAPDWRVTRRQYFFKGHPLLEQAHQRILDGDWYGAADLWHAMEEMSLSRSMRSKAEFNLALAYEMFGDIDEAIRWGVKSYETMYRPLTYNYLERLNVRKQQISGQ